MIGVDDGDDAALRALKEYPERFFASYEVNPNDGMDEVRKIVRAARALRHQGAHRVPVGAVSAGADQRQEVLPDLREVRGARHPDLRLRAACPGPRLPMAPQNVELIDEVCWFFPELQFVMRHGARAVDRARGEADAEVAEPLLLDERLRARSTTRRTSSTSPTRAAPTRSCTRATSRWASRSSASSRSCRSVPFRDDVWPKFLRENAVRVFKL